MKLQKPKVLTFWVAVILAALGVIAQLVTIPVLSGIAIWLVVAGFILLVLGTLITGL